MGVIKKIYKASFNINLTGYTALSNSMTPITHTVITDHPSATFSVLKTENSGIQYILIIIDSLFPILATTVSSGNLSYIFNSNINGIGVSIQAGNFNNSPTQKTSIVDAIGDLYVTIEF